MGSLLHKDTLTFLASETIFLQLHHDNFQLVTFFGCSSGQECSSLIPTYLRVFILGLESVVYLDWLPAKAKMPSLTCYLPIAGKGSGSLSFSMALGQSPTATKIQTLLADSVFCTDKHYISLQLQKCLLPFYFLAKYTLFVGDLPLITPCY